jgi:hypothetical protein
VKGLLLTVDEIHRGVIADLEQLSPIFQHAVREELEVAFAGAGLPASVREVLNVDGLTFLQRADRHLLGAVVLDDVAEAIREPIESSGRRISEANLSAAVVATGGYPFMIQLVGYHIFRQNPDVMDIDEEDVRKDTAAAAKRLGSLVHEPSLRDVPAVGRSFLLAMAQDTGPSSMGDIAERLGVNANYAGQYRLRLLDADLIVAPAFGKVDFALPYLRGYLREHAASLVAGETKPSWPDTPGLPPARSD